ncbi:hypothetical protein BGZ97_010344 [Linnemannia gamsii]|jgi:hypothetical protein|uniref:Uncharacterized protein n=1 Tax=Linnemannia gamsii TaxID=64522 RepID=A0A9P6QPI1_9FUNG|nr:hypothetical protein BGZ97_010344 [Linnemannia gamsii]
MRLSFACLLAAVLPACALAASQESFCEEKVSHRSRLFGRPAYYDLEEKVPAWIFFKWNQIQARPYTDEDWTIVGWLEEKFPVSDFLFDPVILTFNKPKDFAGPFTGRVGRGEILLRWEESGATITGRAPIGDYEISGETYLSSPP